MTWKAGRGKTKLIKEIHEKGYSYRRAEKAVNAFFDRMARALRRGEVVEIPGGTVQCVTNHRKSRRKFQRLPLIGTSKSKYRLIHFPGGGRRIRFTPDKTLELVPIVRPSIVDPAVEKQAQESWDLLVSLLGRDPSPQLVSQLKLPFAQCPDTMLTGVLQRLRHLAQFGDAFTEYRLKRDFYGLAWM